MMNLVDMAEKEGVSVDEFAQSVLQCAASLAHVIIENRGEEERDRPVTFTLYSPGYAYSVKIERHEVPHSEWGKVIERRQTA